MALGDFHEVIDSAGNVRYSWQVQEQSREQSSTSRTNVSRSAELSKKEAAVQKEVMSAWMHGLFKPLNQKSIKDVPQTLAILDQQHDMSDSTWEMAQGQLTAAKAAFAKLDKDLQRYLQQVGCFNKEDELFPQLTLDCCVCNFSAQIMLSINKHSIYTFVYIAYI